MHYFETIFKDNFDKNCAQSHTSVYNISLCLLHPLNSTYHRAHQFTQGKHCKYNICTSWWDI